MTKIKSAYEIAMERARQIDDKLNGEDEFLNKQEELKPLLADFYKERIDAEGLWAKLKEIEDTDLFDIAQRLLLDSIGLKTSKEQLKRRKDGIVAIESLKGGENISFFEQIIDEISSLQDRYNSEQDKYQKMYEEAVENAEMGLKPVRTEDGRTVMQMHASIDEDLEKRIKNAISKVEIQTKELLNNLINTAKDKLSG